MRQLLGVENSAGFYMGKDDLEMVGYPLEKPNDIKYLQYM